jgi:hypothetical protein
MRGAYTITDIVGICEGGVWERYIKSWYCDFWRAGELEWVTVIVESTSGINCLYIGSVSKSIKLFLRCRYAMSARTSIAQWMYSEGSTQNTE